jgi:hypothetical protein
VLLDPDNGAAKLNAFDLHAGKVREQHLCEFHSGHEPASNTEGR